MNTTTNTTRTERASGAAEWVRGSSSARSRGRRGGAPRVARTRSTRTRCPAGTTPPVWREPWLALLDYAELDVLDFPEERVRVQAVRDALCAWFDREPPPTLDAGDLGFTIGLIATAMGSELSDHGLPSQCLRLLSPSALAEYERAKGFVRVSPPSRCRGRDV